MMNNGLGTSDVWKAARLQAASRMTLPSQAFFRPTEVFWNTFRVAKSRGIKLIDCGCGMGTLIEMADMQGFHLRGVDIAKRVGQHKQVERMDALDIKWSPTLWPLICRPDHSGWVEELIRNAQKEGATSVYCGLKRNMKHDIGMFRAQRKLGPPVGIEGEIEYWVEPKKGQRRDAS